MVVFSIVKIGLIDVDTTTEQLLGSAVFTCFGIDNSLASHTGSQVVWILPHALLPDSKLAAKQFTGLVIRPDIDIVGSQSLQCFGDSGVSLSAPFCLVQC